VTNASQHHLDGLKSLMVQLDDPNLIATIHSYGWWPFSVNIAGGICDDDNVIADINGTIDRAYYTFVADGIPVVVDELGLLSFDSTI
jgi:endoglucanase